MKPAALRTAAIAKVANHAKVVIAAVVAVKNSKKAKSASARLPSHVRHKRNNKKTEAPFTAPPSFYYLERTKEFVNSILWGGKPQLGL